MSDIGENRYLVDPNAEVKILNLEARVQERISRINRLNQDIEDLTKMAIKSKQAEIKMLELELNKLKKDLVLITPQDAEFTEGV